MARCHAPRMRGVQCRGLSVQSLTSLEYWIARTSRAMTTSAYSFATLPFGGRPVQPPA
jgi:hypothetical protein